MERINLDICKYCSSDNIHKYGFSKYYQRCYTKQKMGKSISIGNLMGMKK